MNLTHLKTFAVVAGLKHFARAAAASNLSQPAVSHQIARLEREVGARLFNRTGRRVSLTVAGEVLLEEAGRVLAAVDRARERMTAVTSGAVGRIRLGATATAGLYLLPAVLAKYRTMHPTFDLHFEIDGVDTIAERVARNDLDMGIISGMPPTGELQMKPLCGEAFVAIQPADERRTKSSPRVDLGSHCWVLREEGSVTRRIVDVWMRQQGLVPARTMTFNGPEAVKRAVMARLGVSIVPAITVVDDLKRGHLHRLAVGTPLPAITAHVIDHPQKHHGAACRAMLVLLAEAFPRSGLRQFEAAQR
jgi:DNA-binding transcriptional LysR family regulator